FQSGEGGYTEYRLSRDGATWSVPKRVMGADRKPVEGIIEQDPHALPGGRLITAFHTRPGMIVAPFYTDDPLGIRGWRRGRISLLPNDGKVSRELEPSLFLRGDCVVMVFRDEASSFRQLAAESCDRGANWSAPAVTGMPDSRAKQSAGNLPDGTAFLINAPRGDRIRIPLAITLSPDGRTFDRALSLRGESDLQPRRYEGRYKRPGYHYPKSVIWGDHLYVSYATNKEDVELTRVPLTGLRPAPR
ncbi:MAG: exo-alpha-sialidase, partial [Steroidobacteraceae bacterium]|nr:exo-alpha-sialidase [Steroidobacteraceae bacterium]